MRLTITLLIMCLANMLSLAQTPVPYQLHGGKSYHVVAPPSAPKALVVFIPDFNQSTEHLLSDTDMEEFAYVHGVATVVIPCGPKLYADRHVVKQINQVIDSVKSKYEYPEEKIMIGGFGAGGTIALRYAEYCLAYSDDYPIQPKAVFAIDAPVDLTFKHNSLTRELSDQATANGMEPEMVLGIMHRELGGTPEEKTYKYEGLSPFNTFEEKGGNAKHLQSIPVRLYYDTDINWQLSKYHRSLFDMNVLPGSEMVKQLQLQGNHHAELIINTRIDKEHPLERKPGIRLLDEKEWTDWMLGIFKIPKHNDFSYHK
ncbi:hypothetical protein [Marinoscillum furvescens]|uniref:Alpha/beta hydrolase family protein n=1 Tax=Marinoscillum furvescens DSM 4134 TaxID=1122208 RepID=A0A3D9L4W7_MARFU|nr:hypothetical protein [Marinoscillum furvescens]RED97970.1 hypothetical protein C7460_111111 [Marinoscillum furvescens DSM 4134]